jgi:hypothetical protein
MKISKAEEPENLQELQLTRTHVTADDWRADTDEAEHLPVIFVEKVNALLSDVSTSLIGIMRRKGLLIECIEFQWQPDGNVEEAIDLLQPVKRFRAVIEVEKGSRP